MPLAEAASSSQSGEEDQTGIPRGHGAQAVVVDRDCWYGIMYLTHLEEVPLDHRSPRGQGVSTASPSRPQPTAGSGPRPGVHLRQPVLRPSRSGPGEVRDAAPGSRGRRVGQPGSRRLRLLATVLLRGEGGLRSRRPARPVAPAPGTEAGAQAHRGGRRPAPGGAGLRPIPECRADGSTARGGARAPGASPQRGTGAGPATKKGAAAETVNAPQRPDELVRGYEALRAHATGELPAVTPRGLALFLAAGFPVWMKAWTPVTASTPPAPRDDREVRASFGGEVVQLLTEMALGCRRRWA